MTTLLKLFSLAAITTVLAISPAAFAKDYKIKSEKIKKISPISMPPTSLDGVDLNNLVIEHVSRGDITLKEPVKKDQQSHCSGSLNRDHNGDTKIDWKTVKYLEFDYEGPDTIVVVKNRDTNEVITSAQFKVTGYDTFGKGKCTEHLGAGGLVQEFNLNKPKILKKLTKVVEEKTRNKIKEKVFEKLAIKYIPMDFKLYWVKAKADHLDYSALRTARDVAKNAYKTYKKQGYNTDSIAKLNQAVEIWEKEIQDADIKNDKARINQEVAKVIYRNLAVANLFLMAPEKAMEYDTKAVSLSGFGVDSHRDIIHKHRTNSNLSPETLKDTSNLTKVYKASQQVAEQRSIVQAETEFVAFQEAADKSKTLKPKTTAEHVVDALTGKGPKVGSGWDSKVNYSAFNGHHIMMVGGWGARYEEIPEDVCNLHQLNELVVTHNNIAKIPNCIGNLTKLKKLDLSKNKLDEIPAGIGGLTSLKKLVLSKNNISKLPDEIGQLKNLKKLVLKGNPISKDEIKRIKTLLPKCKIKK